MGTRPGGEAVSKRSRRALGTHLGRAWCYPELLVNTAEYNDPTRIETVINRVCRRSCGTFCWETKHATNSAPRSFERGNFSGLLRCTLSTEYVRAVSNFFIRTWPTTGTLCTAHTYVFFVFPCNNTQRIHLHPHKSPGSTSNGSVEGTHSVVPVLFFVFERQSVEAVRKYI